MPRGLADGVAEGEMITEIPQDVGETKLSTGGQQMAYDMTVHGARDDINGGIEDKKPSTGEVDTPRRANAELGKDIVVDANLS